MENSPNSPEWGGIKAEMNGSNPVGLFLSLLSSKF
jgi:hypothetical protein